MKKKLLVFVIPVLFLSCKKNKLGGRSRIEGTVVHHSRFIAFARVFIKFGAREFPGSDTTLYDAKVTADEKGKYTINCYKGNYYLYGYGYDEQLMEPVKGGLRVNIRHRETVNTDVPVTE